MSICDHPPITESDSPCSIAADSSPGNGAEERLRRVRRNVLELMQLAREVSRSDEAACAAILADLLEIADCWAAGADDSRSHQVTAVLDFSESALIALEETLAAQAANPERIAQIQNDAQRQWGDYLGLLEPSERTSPESISNPWQQLLPEIDNVALLAAPATESVELCQEDMAAVLAALASATADSAAHEAPSAVYSSDTSAAPGSTAKLIECNKQAETTVQVPLTSLPGSALNPPTAARLELDDELRCAYLEDAQRGVAVMEQSLLELEADPTNAESLHQLGRALHTLKGASASVGLAELARYLHDLEDFLQECTSSRQGRLDVQPMLVGVDVVRAQMAALVASGGTPATADARHVEKGDRATPRMLGGDPPVTPLSVVSHPVATKPSEESIRVEATRLDRLMDLLGELVILRNRRDTQVGRLKQIHTELMRTTGRLRMLGEILSAGTMVDFHSRNLAAPSSPTQEADATSSSHHSYVGIEIANDVSEIARSLRELYEPVMDENLATSRLMGQFRHELMELRRLPLSGLFLRLQRAARDAAHAEGKQVQFEVRGEHAGLEPSLQERLYEPLLHLVRNAVSHGIESQADRVAHGKSPIGTVTIETRGDPTSLVIEVCDDGKGLDYDAIQRRGLESGLLERDRPASPWQLAQLIFHPGFSTRHTVTEVSGRGVGLDVVANVLDRLRGQIEVESSPGQGTAVRLRIPLRSSIEHTMVYRVDGHLFALPMQFVQAAKPTGVDLHRIARPTQSNPGNPPLSFTDVSRQDLPLVRVRELLSLDSTPRPAEEQTLVVSQGAAALAHSRESNPSGPLPARLQSGRIALMVDGVVGPEEVVVRSLPPLFKRHRLLAGVTLSGAGEIVLLLDGRELIERAVEHVAAPSNAAQPQPASAEQRTASAPLKVLVVDDSVSVRRSLSRMFERRGFVVSEAADGLEALDLLRTFAFSLVFTDLEMPRLGGIELLAEIRRSRRTRPVPVVVVSSVKGQEVQDRVRELGANGYLAKPVTDSNITQVLDTVRLDGASE